MKLTKLETDILLEALEAHQDHRIAMLEANIEVWESSKNIKTQELKERTVFKLNTLDRMIKSVKEGTGLSCT